VGNRDSLPGVKHLGREADHSLQYSAKVNTLPNTPSWRGSQLKAQGQLNLLLIHNMIFTWKAKICI